MVEYYTVVCVYTHITLSSSIPPLIDLVLCYITQLHRHGWLSTAHVVLLGLCAKLCPTLCDPMDFSPPGSSVYGILQARILKNSEVKWSSVAQSCPTLCKPMDCSMPDLPVHHQLPEFVQPMFIESGMPSNHLTLYHPFLLLPSIFPTADLSHSSGYPFPSPGNLPDPEIEPGSPALQTDSLPSEPPGAAKSVPVFYTICKYFLPINKLSFLKTPFF